MAQTEQTGIPISGGIPGAANAQNSGSTGARSGVRTMIAFVAIILGFFMALLDATIVNVSLPEMAKTYNASVESISWIVNAYNLAFAVFILTAARLADQFGRKRVFLIGSVGFVAASVAAAFAPTVEFLIAMRVLQGLAGAIVVPVTVPLATNLFPREKFGMVMGIWGAVAGLAAASGPTLGGILTSAFGWPSIFFVNLPVGLLSIVLSLILLKESRDPSAAKKIDVPGVVLVSVAMFALVFALINANDWGWGSVGVIGLFSLSLVSWIVFFIVEARSKHPMLPMELFKIRVFNGAAFTIFALGAGIISSVFLMSFYLRQVMQYDVLGAGLMLSVTSLASMVSSAVSGPLSNRFDSRYFSISGILIMALALFLYTGLDAQSSSFDILWRLALMGIGMGMSFTPVMGSGIRAVPENKVGMASGISNMTRALGGVLGVALIVTILNASLTPALEDARVRAHSYIAADTVLRPELKAELDKAVDATTSTRAAGEADGAGKETAASEGSSVTASAGASSNASDRAMLDALEKRETEVLAATPESGRESVKTMFAQQRAEMLAVSDYVRRSFTDGLVGAFHATFIGASVMMLLGVFFAVVSDKRRGRGRASDGEASRTDSGAVAFAE